MSYAITWSPTFLIGDDRIDLEHRELIKVANLVLELQGADKDTLAALFNGLYKYTKFHFANEEAYMREIGYPHLAEHHILHKSIVTKMNRVLKEARSLDDLQGKLRTLMYNWVVQHISENDARIATWRRDHAT